MQDREGKRRVEGGRKREGALGVQKEMWTDLKCDMTSHRVS